MDPQKSDVPAISFTPTSIGCERNDVRRVPLGEARFHDEGVEILCSVCLSDDDWSAAP